MKLTIKQKPEKKQKNKVGSWNNREAGVEISLLENSMHYFLHYVFIVEDGEEFRLVVIHNNRVLTDQCYESLRGARIAFSKYYDGKAWNEDVKAQWTHFYPPDETWLADKLKASVCAKTNIL